MSFSTVTALNSNQQLQNVRVVAESNITGTYFNGPNNNGVGATFTCSTGALVIDGVTISRNDDVLLTAQTSAFQNGIYTCIQAGATGVAAILKRRGDFQCREQIQGGYYIPVSAGTASGGSMWTMVEPLPAAIGNPSVSGANNINFVSTASSGGEGVFLEVANNLSDVDDVGDSRDNLGLGVGQTVGFANLILSVPGNNLAANATILSNKNGSNNINQFTLTANAPTSAAVATTLKSDATATNVDWLLKDPGTTSTNLLMTHSTQSMAVNGMLNLDKSSGVTDGSGNITLNTQCCNITTPSLTTAAGASFIINLTNNKITASSVMLVTSKGGTNTTPLWSIVANAFGAGTASIIITNTSGVAFNGTFILNVLIV